MQTVTLDTTDFLLGPELRVLIFQAIDAYCEREYADNPERGASESILEKSIVNDIFAMLEKHESSQRVMLIAYLKY